MSEQRSMELAEIENDRERQRARSQEEHGLRVLEAEDLEKRARAAVGGAEVCANNARNAISRFQAAQRDRLDVAHETIDGLQANAERRLSQALAEARGQLTGEDRLLNEPTLIRLAGLYVATLPGFADALRHALDAGFEYPLSTLTGDQVAERVAQARQHEAKVAAASTRIRGLLRVVVAGRQVVELEGVSDLGPLRQAADDAEAAAQEAGEARERVRLALDGV